MEHSLDMKNKNAAKLLSWIFAPRFIYCMIPVESFNPKI